MATSRFFHLGTNNGCNSTRNFYMKEIFHSMFFFVSWFSASAAELKNYCRDFYEDTDKRVISSTNSCKSKNKFRQGRDNTFFAYISFTAIILTFFTFLKCTEN